MAQSPQKSEVETVSYHGEVWTDGRGYATVELPDAAHALVPPVEYEFRDLGPETSARVTAELAHGRFTIATDGPHVKVGWHISARRRPTPERRV